MTRTEVMIQVALLNNKNRAIAIWGLCPDAYEIKKRLLELGFEQDIFFVDSNVNKVNNIDVFLPLKLANRSDDIYVICPVGYHNEIEEKLTENNYEWITDYLYLESRFYHHEKPFIIKQEDDYYADNYGNVIIGHRVGVEFEFEGFCNKIVIGNGTMFVNSFIRMDVGATLKIGEGNTFGSRSFIRLWEGANVNIGDNNTVMTNFQLSAEQDCIINIGNDCLFSHNVLLWGNDGHCIFDIISGELLNYTDSERKKRNIIIGNHVWLGYEVNVLYKSVINDGSIVGLKSVVKSVIPNNVIVAGAPARIVRKNVAWSKAQARSIEECGADYIRMTELTSQ